MPSLEMSIQNVRVRMEESAKVLMREKPSQNSSRQVLVTEQNWTMGKEVNCLSVTGKVIFSRGNRKEIIWRWCRETSWNNLRDRVKKICKRSRSQASDEFKWENMYRRNKATTATVVRWNISKRKKRSTSDRGGHNAYMKRERQERSRRWLPGS